MICQKTKCFRFLKSRRAPISESHLSVQVIGLGTVGKAQAYLLQKLGHIVYGYDPYLNDQNTPKGVILAKEMLTDVDMTFICTPEKSVDYIIAEMVMRKVQGLIVIKSTVPLGTTQRLMQCYKIHLCHNPEFLRDNKAFEDAINPSRIVIGFCCQTHSKKLVQLYKPLNKPIFEVSPTTSEAAKLTSNSLRAVNISFWNELSILCQETGVKIDELSEISDTAKVLGEWEGGKWGQRFFGKPYGGKCLPKDLEHLMAAFKSNGLNPAILEATKKINDTLRNQQ